MSERFWAVIPAAGIGSRMGADIPKQYLQLAGRTVLDHSIERLLTHPMMDGLVISLRASDQWWPASEFAEHPDVMVAAGGAERCHSVLNSLARLQEHPGAGADDWVLVHDAARPCVRREDISRLVDAVRDQGQGGILGVPVRDTMKRTGAGDQIEHTVDREHLWHAFTPQMFRLDELHGALSALLHSGGLVTDEAGAMEAAGMQPVMVEGASDNIKVTRPEDLALAEFHLISQERENP